MKYRIVKNGLWGNRALDRRDFDGSRGLFDIQQFSESLEQAIERRSRGEIQIRFVTGEQGMRDFEQALEREIQRQAEQGQVITNNSSNEPVWTTMPVITGTEGNVEEEFNQYEQLWNEVRREGDIPQITSYRNPSYRRQPTHQELAYMRLQSGDITTVEYLDIMSEEE